MSKLILWMLGLSPTTVKNLQREVRELNTTINTLKSDATEFYNKVEQTVILFKKLGIDKNKQRWWEDDNIRFEDFETQILANSIRDAGMRGFIKEHPSLKERFVFHGGCLGCQTPINEGCGTCLGCDYSNFNSGLPDLST